MDNQIDPRWQTLLGREWTCATCHKTHRGAFDLACTRPDFWSEGEDYVPNSEALTSTHFLSEDFCVLKDEHYFIRCVCTVPLIDAPPGHTFSYGVWSTLSRHNFGLYKSTFDSGEQSDLGPWFGWFSNRLSGYPDTLNLKCQVHPQAGRQRPWIELEATDHPLAVEQAEGITFDRLIEIYSTFGHSILRAVK